MIEINIDIVVDDEVKSIIISQEELEQMVCNKAREDNLGAKNVYCYNTGIGIKVK